VFPKLAKAITVAAREGVPDPEVNSRLRTAIMNAKAQNMPKDNIDAAIKRAAGKDVDTFSEVFFEGKGPHGVLIFIECATDNNTRTVANVKSYFNKFGGTLGSNGSLEFMFSRRAVFEFEKPADFDIEELEFDLIESGLESTELYEDTVYVYGDYTNFGTLSKALEDKGIEVTKATLQRIPNTHVEFSEEHLVDIEKLIDRIEDDDDVQAVYTNIA
jgi:YebC/PmpR family DNA-binding regulatory protein